MKKRKFRAKYIFWISSSFSIKNNLILAFFSFYINYKIGPQKLLEGPEEHFSLIIFSHLSQESYRVLLSLHHFPFELDPQNQM